MMASCINISISSLTFMHLPGCDNFGLRHRQSNQEIAADGIGHGVSCALAPPSDVVNLAPASVHAGLDLNCTVLYGCCMGE